MTRDEKCPICGKGKLTREVLEESFKYKGRTMVVPGYVVYACDTCGERIVEQETLERSGKILGEFKRVVDDGPRYARTSFKGPYKCAFPWPEDCFVQCGSMGIVMAPGSFEKVFGSSDPLGEISGSVSYTTAFFEAFPNDIIPGNSIFIRGEGKTIAEAEKKTWGMYMRYKACDHPAYERRRHTNGGGFCMKCGMFNDRAFDPLTKCVICGKPTYYSFDTDNVPYCKEHTEQMPEDKIPEWKKQHKKEMAEMEAAANAS